MASMFNLDPAKLLILAVVVVIVLGPDRLPGFARRVGGIWRSFIDYRHRMEHEVRSSLPDLPSSVEISRLARSPSALFDRLANLPSPPSDGLPAAQPIADATERTVDPLLVAEHPVRSPEADLQLPGDPGMN